MSKRIQKVKKEKNPTPEKGIRKNEKEEDDDYEAPYYVIFLILIWLPLSA
jgi:hypothetical protein